MYQGHPRLSCMSSRAQNCHKQLCLTFVRHFLKTTGNCYSPDRLITPVYSSSASWSEQSSTWFDSMTGLLKLNQKSSIFEGALTWGSCCTFGQNSAKLQRHLITTWPSLDHRLVVILEGLLWILIFRPQTGNTFHSQSSSQVSKNSQLIFIWCRWAGRQSTNYWSSVNQDVDWVLSEYRSRSGSSVNRDDDCRFIKGIDRHSTTVSFSTHDLQALH